MLQALRRQGGRELAILLQASTASAHSSEVSLPCQSAHSRSCTAPSTSAAHTSLQRWSRSPATRSFACASSPLLFQGNNEQQTGREDRTPSADVTLASRILQQISVNNLVKHLEDEAVQRIVLPVAELHELIRQHGITEDRAEAAKIIGALQTAGIILRYEGKIFLRTSEVAELVVRSLPDTVEEAQGRIQELSAELAPLEVQRSQIERQASIWRGFVAWSGLVMLVTQFVLFARLTYWELSWDVMEPISYFAGQLVMIGCYMYFLLTNRDFGYEQHFGMVTQKVRQRLMVRRHFDETRYLQLKQELARWQRYSRALATKRA